MALVQSLCSPGIPSSPGGQSQISCEWMWCGVAAEGGNGRGKTGTKDENHVVYTKLASLMAHIKESLLMQETRVRSLGLEDRLEKEMATHSTILA